jgi:hypothetical protein
VNAEIEIFYAHQISFRLDVGLHKTFKMPWEGQALTFRWEVFNVTNTQKLTGFNGTGLTTDPFYSWGASSGWFWQHDRDPTAAWRNKSRSRDAVCAALRFLVR